MANDTDKALIAYMEMVDAGFQGASLSGIISERVGVCLKKLNTFVNLDDAKRPALVDPYKPENYKPRPPVKSGQQN